VLGCEECIYTNKDGIPSISKHSCLSLLPGGAHGVPGGGGIPGGGNTRSADRTAAAIGIYKKWPFRFEECREGVAVVRQLIG